MDELVKKADILIEALPYIRRFSGKTIVIKYGGAAMENDALKDSVMQDVVLMKYTGMHPVVVHGGGAQISEWMGRIGKEAEFVQGLRITDQETVEIAEMVLAGTINKEIVALINQHGGRAVGLCGKDADLIRARKHFAEIVDDLMTEFPGLEHQDAAEVVERVLEELGRDDEFGSLVNGKRADLVP